MQNNIHVKVLGDLDHDGIKDFVINAYNDKGCQCFQVIKGKDLSVRYSLLKDGVVYENEEDSFSVTGINLILIKTKLFRPKLWSDLNIPVTA